MSDPIAWNHSPLESTAEWNGMALKVSCAGAQWSWEIRTPRDVLGSMGIDRIGACADAEGIARAAHIEDEQ